MFNMNQSFWDHRTCVQLDRCDVISIVRTKWQLDFLLRAQTDRLSSGSSSLRKPSQSTFTSLSLVIFFKLPNRSRQISLTMHSLTLKRLTFQNLFAETTQVLKNRANSHEAWETQLRVQERSVAQSKLKEKRNKENETSTITEIPQKKSVLHPTS